MKQILTLIILIFLLSPIYGQKSLEIPENKVIESFMKSLPKNIEKLKLQDLRTSEDSINIRIWQTHNVFTINQNSDSTFLDYKIFTTNKDLVFKSFNFTENISQKIMDSISVETIMNLKDENYRGIDGSFVFLEVSTDSRYKIVSYWSPKSERNNDCKTVVEILGVINSAIDSNNLSNNFLNTLPSGSYRWGMTSIRIDRFLDKDVAKTDFYSRAEKKMEQELSITDKTNHWAYPLILVNNKPAMISDLNKYNDKEIAKFEVLKPDNNLIVLYGTNGSNGVVLIETK